MRVIKPFMSLNMLKNTYSSYFIMIISYGLPFWGNSLHSIQIFRMQKRTIRIMIGCNSRVSCRNLLKRLENLPILSQYILSLMHFEVKNKIFFILNSENYTKSTSQFNNFYQPINNLTIYQRRVHYMGIKIFNSLSPYTKVISNNVREFEICLKDSYRHRFLTP